MKNYFKKITPVIILAFVASFMLFIYEPIITYSANINDFWFDFKLMLPNILLYFAVLFTGMLLLYTIIYLIFCKLFKKNILYKIILAISFVVFIYTYIQGNYLIGNLPVLDGTTIVWNSFFKDNIISICVIVVLTILEVFLIIKFKMNKAIKINNFIKS